MWSSSSDSREYTEKKSGILSRNNMKNHQKGSITTMVLLAVIILLVIVGGIYLYKNNTATVPVSVNTGTQQSNQVQQQDSTTGWKTYTNTQYGFSIQYPTDLIDGGVQPFSDYLYIQDSDFGVVKRLEKTSDELVQISTATSAAAVSSCLAYSSNSDEVSNTGNVAINGIQFAKYDFGRVGLSHRFRDRIFSTVRNNTCYRIEIIESWLANPEPAIDAIKEFTPIVMSFKFTPTTSITTEKASGIIKSVYSKSGKNYIDIDYIEWNPNWSPGGRENNKGPAYYNNNSQIRTFEISKNATILLSGGTDVEINYQYFYNLFIPTGIVNGVSTYDYQKYNPWDIIVTNGVITQIKEHFLP